MAPIILPQQILMVLPPMKNLSRCHDPDGYTVKLLSIMRQTVVGTEECSHD